MQGPKVKSGGLTIAVSAAETADAIDDAALDHLLAVMQPDAAVGFDLGGGRAVLLGCGRVEVLRHPANPMVWLVGAGDEDEVAWATEKVLVDGWTDLGLTIELPSGQLVVRDAMGRGRQSVAGLPPGAYRVLEYRGVRSWICLVVARSFWERLEG